MVEQVVLGLAIDDLAQNDLKTKIEELIGLDSYSPSYRYQSSIEERDNRRNQLDESDLTKYLAIDISESEPLTPDQEAQIAQLLNNTRENIDILTQAIEIQPDKDNMYLFEQLRQYEYIQDAIVSILMERNTRYAMQLAAKYTGSGVPVPVLFSGAVTGLEKAARKFDGSTKFSTYSNYWMRSEIVKVARDYNDGMRRTSHIDEFLHKKRTVIREFGQTHGRVPTDEELIEALAAHYLEKEEQQGKIITDKRIQRKRNWVRQELIITKAFEHMISYSVRENNEQEEEDPDEYMSFISDESIINTVETSDLARILEELEEIFTGREILILKMRFGLDGHREHTSWKDIGEKMDLTGERVRQLAEIALKKLRQPHRAAKLKDYWE
jgi:RNA polymerase sigma factor (sigma-70 family)